MAWEDWHVEEKKASVQRVTRVTVAGKIRCGTERSKVGHAAGVALAAADAAASETARVVERTNSM